MKAFGRWKLVVLIAVGLVGLVSEAYAEEEIFIVVAAKSASEIQTFKERLGDTPGCGTEGEGDDLKKRVAKIVPRTWDKKSDPMLREFYVCRKGTEKEVVAKFPLAAYGASDLVVTMSFRSLACSTSVRGCYKQTCYSGGVYCTTNRSTCQRC